MGKAISPLFFERYELKYFLTPLQALEVEKYIACFCDLDPFSEKMEDHHYPINNLYFDTPNNLFLERRRAGIDHRFNMRVRSYGSDPVPPYLFEIKNKSHGVVIKTRAKVRDDNWAQPLMGGSSIDCNDSKSSIIDVNSDFYHQFLYLAHSYNATPKIFTNYKRKAYASNIDEYARVTFDKELKYMKRTDYCLKPDDEKMVNYDFPDNFDGGESTVILELKCNLGVPKWFVDLITTFDLKQRGFSKYAKGMDEVEGGFSFSPNDYQSNYFAANSY